MLTLLLMSKIKLFEILLKNINIRNKIFKNIIINFNLKNEILKNTITNNNVVNSEARNTVVIIFFSIRCLNRLTYIELSINNFDRRAITAAFANINKISIKKIKYN